nr:DEAD-box ATP-dependent RNA helicase [Ipomoea batatas]
MSEPKSEPSSISVSEKGVKAPNVFVRVKEEFEAVLHSQQGEKTHGESHGKRPDLDEKTPMSEVKAPNVFGRAKEEIEALVQTIHTKKESGGSDSCEELRDSSSNSEKDAKGPSWIEKSKKEMEDLVNKMKSPRSHHHQRHHTETHGMSDDIDENTPVSNVKGPNVFARAKEEIEAIVEAIHPKKEGR